MPDLIPAVPDDVRREAARIAATPGVYGVFYGRTAAARGRSDAPGLIALVERRRSPIQVRSAVLPTELVPIDRPAVHAALLDLADAIHTDDLPRTGTLTALARAGGGVIGLTAGHVVLPTDRNHEIVDEYVPDALPVRVAALDASGARFGGVVEAGRLGGPVDWATIRFDDAAALGHPAVGDEPPFTPRARTLTFGEVVRHVSRKRDGARMSGTFEGVAAHPMDLLLADGTTMAYSGFALIEAPAERRFSVGGDSGSLVVDDNRRVVGVVLGGSPAPPGTMARAFVLSLDPLRAALGDRAKLFFAE